MMPPSAVIVFLFALSGSNAFAPRAPVRQGTALTFGLPSFGAKDDDKKEANKEPEKKIDFKGLIQLITAGAGSPFLGDYEGTDPETGKMMFSLEANNLVDEVCFKSSIIFVLLCTNFIQYYYSLLSLDNAKNGESKQTKMPYFESGWVSEEDLEKERNKKPFKFPWDK
jgi:hypothetical protein